MSCLGVSYPGWKRVSGLLLIVSFSPGFDQVGNNESKLCFKFLSFLFVFGKFGCRVNGGFCLVS